MSPNRINSISSENALSQEKLNNKFLTTKRKKCQQQQHLAHVCVCCGSSSSSTNLAFCAGRVLLSISVDCDHTVVRRVSVGLVFFSTIKAYQLLRASAPFFLVVFERMETEARPVPLLLFFLFPGKLKIKEISSWRSLKLKWEKRMTQRKEEEEEEERRDRMLVGSFSIPFWHCVDETGRSLASLALSTPPPPIASHRIPFRRRDSLLLLLLLLLLRAAIWSIAESVELVPNSWAKATAKPQKRLGLNWWRE